MENPLGRGVFCDNLLKEKGNIMTALPRFFCILFAMLAIGSIGHDVWRMQTTGSEFAFSQIGGLLTLYAKTEHNEARTMIADEIGAEGFNTLFVPILKSYTAAFLGGIALLFGLWGFFSHRKLAAGGSGRDSKGSGGMRFKR